MEKYLPYVASALLLLLAVPLFARADDDDDDDDDHHRVTYTHAPAASTPAAPTAAPTVASAYTPGAGIYATECASCHVAYPPALLPARSWSAILADLNRHYGDDASLPPERVATLDTFLRANAGDTVGIRRTARISASSTPDRITTLDWFVNEHDELPPSFVTGNPEVRSFANCAACHPSAATGRFSEHDIRIPGRRWSDD